MKSAVGCQPENRSFPPVPAPHGKCATIRLRNETSRSAAATECAIPPPDGVRVTVNVCVEPVSLPPFAVPPLSCNWTVTVAVPPAFAAGVKVSTPRELVAVGGPLGQKTIAAAAASMTTATIASSFFIRSWSLQANARASRPVTTVAVGAFRRTARRAGEFRRLCVCW